MEAFNDIFKVEIINDQSSNASDDDNNLSNTTAQNLNATTISVKAEQNSDVNVSVRMRTDNSNNGGAAANKKRRRSSSKSPENRAKKLTLQMSN
jgi:hypothetical protein